MVDTDMSKFDYLKRTKTKARYVRLHYFAKSFLNFNLLTIVGLAFASFYLFMFYGGFAHPFFEYGPAMIVDSWFMFVGLNLVGAVAYALAKEKILLKNNTISLVDDSVNIVRGLIFKRKFSHPFKHIVKINAHQSFFAKRLGLVKVEFILIDSSSFMVGMMDEDKFKKFESKLSSKINNESEELLSVLIEENGEPTAVGENEPVATT